MWNLGHWATTFRSPIMAMQATGEEESVSPAVLCAKNCNQARKGSIGVFNKNLIGEKLVQVKAFIDSGSTHLFCCKRQIIGCLLTCNKGFHKLCKKKRNSKFFERKNSQPKLRQFGSDWTMLPFSTFSGRHRSFSGCIIRFGRSLAT